MAAGTCTRSSGRSGVRRAWGSRAHALFGGLGCPQNRFRAAHGAGAAGKGSVSTFVASLLGAHGCRVGTHPSPHVYNLLERFQLDGGPAPAVRVDATLDRIRPAASVLVATQFCTDGGDHPASVSIPAERLAAAAADPGIPAVVERNPMIAVSRAAETGAAVPVVASGSCHLLAAVHGATVPP